MALVSFLPADRFPIPHEPGQWMALKKPRSKAVKEARRIVESEGRRGVRDFGAEIVKALNDGDDDEKAARRLRKLEELEEYAPDQFDRDTLLLDAIKGWSYESEPGKMAPINAETVADLDEETARWAHHAIVGLMKRSKEADKSLTEAPAPSA